MLSNAPLVDTGDNQRGFFLKKLLSIFDLDIENPLGGCAVCMAHETDWLRPRPFRDGFA
jgi:hypothetical protein